MNTAERPTLPRGLVSYTSTNGTALPHDDLVTADGALVEGTECPDVADRRRQ